MSGMVGQLGGDVGEPGARTDVLELDGSMASASTGTWRALSSLRVSVIE
jgi:hypothetical protein